MMSGRVPFTERDVLVTGGAGLAILIVLLVSDRPGAAWAPAIAISALIAFTALRRDRAQHQPRSARARPPAAARAATEFARTDDLTRAESGPGGGTPRAISSVSVGAFRAADRRRDDAQCPECGRFLVDVKPGRLFRFRCRTCGAVWSAAANRPWPDVHVVPDLDRAARQSPIAE